MPGGNAFGQQRVRDRKHAARSHPHHKTHEQVELKLRHRTADSSAYEHDAGEQYRGSAADPVRDDAPNIRTNYKT